MKWQYVASATFAHVGKSSDVIFCELFLGCCHKPDYIGSKDRMIN
jgi:hypothetical protein